MKHAHQQETHNYESSTLPYVCWYQNDFLGDVRGMRSHEIGIYTILLNEMYARGRPLEISVGRLARLCGCDKRTFTSVLEMLISEGKILNLANGLWNQRCENVFHERIKLLEKKSFAGRASAKKRKEINERVQQLLNEGTKGDKRNSEAQIEEEKQTPSGVCEKRSSSSQTREKREWGESFTMLSSPLTPTRQGETERLPDSAKNEGNFSHSGDDTLSLLSSRQKSGGLQAIPKGQRLPSDWTADISAAVAEGLSEDQARWQEKKFRDYWHAKSGKEALKVDWHATWRNWFRREIERIRENQKRPSPISSHTAQAPHSNNDDAIYRSLINYRTI
ncbi:YdaU family protein [Bartonella sp. CB178]|uniref:YdaU family protein n=1 Tax=Bartonella sp. CB178 TaxID=3112255 RepID=UPI00300E0DA8